MSYSRTPAPPVEFRDIRISAESRSLSYNAGLVIRVEVAGDRSKWIEAAKLDALAKHPHLHVFSRTEGERIEQIASRGPGTWPLWLVENLPDLLARAGYRDVARRLNVSDFRRELIPAVLAAVESVEPGRGPTQPLRRSS